RHRLRHLVWCGHRADLHRGRRAVQAASGHARADRHRPHHRGRGGDERVFEIGLALTARTGTLGRLSSWRWLAAWLCLACLTYLGYLPTATAATQEFNRAAELARYRAWLKDFTQDLDRLSATRRPLSDA